MYTNEWRGYISKETVLLRQWESITALTKGSRSKRQLLNSFRWQIYLINWVDNIKLPCYTLPPTQKLTPLYIWQFTVHWSFCQKDENCIALVIALLLSLVLVDGHIYRYKDLEGKRGIAASQDKYIYIYKRRKSRGCFSNILLNFCRNWKLWRIKWGLKFRNDEDEHP